MITFGYLDLKATKMNGRIESNKPAYKAKFPNHLCGFVLEKYGKKLVHKEVCLGNRRPI
jgi:hypothetical protein